MQGAAEAALFSYMKGGRTLKGMFISADNNFRIIDLKEPALDSVSQVIGGDPEQVWPRRLPRPYLMIVNGEGRLDGLPQNFVGSYLYGMDEHGEPIAGDVVILKEKQTREGSEWCSLHEKDIIELTAQMNSILQNRQLRLVKEHYKNYNLER